MTHFVPLRQRLSPNRNAVAFGFHLGVFILYGVMVWAIIFGHSAPSTLTDHLVGQGPDPSLFVWFLAWWPTHWLHPWHSFLIWAPTGVQLGWVTTVPALAALATPLTLLVGPMPTYNLMMCLGLCLTAFATYLLGYEWHHRPRIAFVQGLLMGISPYLIGQAWDGHLNLVWMPVPLIMALLALKYWRGQLAPRYMTEFFAIGILLQFFISTEVLATFTLVLGLALALAVLVPGSGHAIIRLVKAVSLAYALALIILSPWLYIMFQHAAPVLHASPVSYSIDPLNWVIPTSLTLGGQWFTRTSSWFPGNLGEASGYLGLPWILLLILQLRHRPIRRTGLMAGYALFVLILVLALGPKLHWYGWTHGWLPESLLTYLPLLGLALPSRLMFYADVVGVLLLTPCLTNRNWPKWVRVGLTGTIILSLLPNIWVRPDWTQMVTVPRFYQRSVITKILPRHATVVIWPYNTAGNSMIWQAESHFWFRMAGGYVAPAAPPPYNTWPFVTEMATLPWQYGPYWRSNLALFLSTNRVNAVLTPPRPPIKVQKLLSAVGLKPSVKAGVDVWSGTLPHGDSPLEASAISTLSLLQILVHGAAQYVHQNHPIVAINPMRLEQDGDLPGFFGYFGPGMAQFVVAPYAFIEPGVGQQVVVGTLASRAQVPLLTPYLSQLGTVYSVPIPGGSRSPSLVTLRVIIPVAKFRAKTLPH